jgi:signal transduction histidine kinase
MAAVCPKRSGPKLFSSFFSTKGVKGTGLGLLVTAKLVEEHKGSIDVVSTEGEGTTFILSAFPSSCGDWRRDPVN